MLVARRDPPFHVDVHDPVPANAAIYPPLKASRLTRFVTAVQMVGSLLAVPVGIASGYSFYRANFSPETTCQSLRSGIVAMLDKSVDATTRRILVRRDVEAFEKTCGTVDPEATAAFKSLLASEKKTASVPVAPRPKPPLAKFHNAPRLPRLKSRCTELNPAPQAPAKQPAAVPTNVVAEPQRRDPVISDTQWLDAVRQALVTHKEQIRPSPETAKPQSNPDTCRAACSERECRTGGARRPFRRHPLCLLLRLRCRRQCPSHRLRRLPRPVLNIRYHRKHSGFRAACERRYDPAGRTYAFAHRQMDIGDSAARPCRRQRPSMMG